MRLNPLLYGCARRRTARAPQEEPVPFKMLLPLELKNSVSGKSDRTKETACIQEMTVMFACFKKNEFDQVHCLKEVNAFQTCYKGFQERYTKQREHDRKGILIPGEKKLSHRQMNQLLKKYPGFKKEEPKE